MRRGEIWWYADEQVPRRPVLVLSRDAVVDRLTHVIGVPATTVVRGIPSEVAVGTADGMPRECVLSTDSVGQFRRALLTDRVTAAEPLLLQRVCDALSVATGCETSDPV